MVWYSNSEGRYGARGAKGDLGESIVNEYCKVNNILFEDKNDRTSQVVLKIDCLINGIPVDVKSNYYKGRLAVELWTKNNQPGWLYNTTAEEIYGVDVDTKSIYRYNVEEMKLHVKENKSHAKKSQKGDVLMWVSVANTSIITQLQ
jgi:hypothetical protein